MPAPKTVKAFCLLLWLTLAACQSNDSPDWLSNAASKSATADQGECTSFKRMNGKC